MTTVLNSKVFSQEELLDKANKGTMEDVEYLVSKGYAFTIDNGVVTKVEKECEK